MCGIFGVVSSSPVNEDELNVLGHSCLITNGLGDNQPLVRDGVVMLHNCIVVNDEALWGEIGKKPLTTLAGAQVSICLLLANWGEQA